MNERTRRHQQTRRNNSQQPSTHSTSHHHHNINNRSIYQGHHQVDTYSTSNYRHPSTTTTTTDPSSIAPSQASSSDCVTSICYLYLVAIISSFLVVLGIYLSLTQFNVRFLYISLLGLSIEAIGACIYCISNIRSSQLAKRKQRIGSNEFTLQNGLSNIENNPNNRRQQITTITHMLTNRTLNPSSSTHDTNDNIQNIENVPTAINDNDVGDEHLHNQLTTTSLLDVEADNLANQASSQEGSDSVGRDGNSIIVISDQPQQSDEQTASNIACSSSTQSSSIDQLPKRSRCQQSPEGLIGDFQSSTGLLESQQNSLIVEQQLSPHINTNPIQTIYAGQDEARDVGGEQNIQNQLSINMVSQFNNSQLGDNNAKITSKPKHESTISNVWNTENETQAIPQELQQPSSANPAEITTATAPQQIPQAVDVETSNFRDGSDLIDLQQGGSGISSDRGGGLVESDPVAEPQIARRRQAQVGGQQRAAKIRRTLVMGLSGEEEMIEIDEEDLDNMSILPPSYESIAATNTRPQ